jgi:hypothetical protein
LGEADLNLANFGNGDFKIIKLSLKKCADDDAFIEVGLRGTEASATRKESSKSSSKGGAPRDEDKEKIKFLL